MPDRTTRLGPAVNCPGGVTAQCRVGHFAAMRFRPFDLTVAHAAVSINGICTPFELQKTSLRYQLPLPAYIASRGRLAEQLQLSIYRHTDKMAALGAGIHSHLGTLKFCPPWLLNRIPCTESSLLARLLPRAPTVFVVCPVFDLGLAAGMYLQFHPGACIYCRG